jgi:hypothetical protein
VALDAKLVSLSGVDVDGLDAWDVEGAVLGGLAWNGLLDNAMPSTDAVERGKGRSVGHLGGSSCIPI